MCKKDASEKTVIADRAGFLHGAFGFRHLHSSLYIRIEFQCASGVSLFRECRGPHWLITILIKQAATSMGLQDSSVTFEKYCLMSYSCRIRISEDIYYYVRDVFPKTYDSHGHVSFT